MIKSRLDQFLGRGQAAVTVPSLDGALKPNNLLEEAPAGIEGDAPDNMVFFNEQPLWSEGAQLFLGQEKTLFSSLESEITAIAVSDAGELIVAMLDGGIQLLDGNGQPNKRIGSLAINCVTAMVFLDSQTLLIAVGSIQNPLVDWARDLLEQRANGQLIRLDLTNGQASIVAQNLAYPAGLLIKPDGSVIVSEAWSCRLSQVDMKSGRVTPLMEDLPAYPGRIVASADGGCWLSMFAPRSPLIEFVLRELAYRKAMMEEVDPEFWIAPALKSGYSFHEPMQGGAMKQMGILKPWAPTRSYGLVIEVDDRFVPIRSFHSRAGGKRHGVTSGMVQDNRLWITSKGGGEILSIDLDDVVGKEIQ
ncbi:MAG: strictosidine synthase [Sneathiella sp.]